MNYKWAWVGALTTLVMGPWHFSMAQEPTVIRAQGGVMYPDSGPVIYGDEYCDECDDGHCSPFRKCWTYVFTLGGKRQGYPSIGARDPRQMNTQYRYRYRAPQDLRYPAANQPAGVVVYPYYTVKGPDDFFLNETLTD